MGSGALSFLANESKAWNSEDFRKQIKSHTIGSMVLLYMVLHGSHQYTPFMLVYQHHGSYGNGEFLINFSKLNWKLMEILSNCHSNCPVSSHHSASGNKILRCRYVTAGTSAVSCTDRRRLSLHNKSRLVSGPKSSGQPSSRQYFWDL